MSEYQDELHIKYLFYLESPSKLWREICHHKKQYVGDFSLWIVEQYANTNSKINKITLIDDYKRKDVNCWPSATIYNTIKHRTPSARKKLRQHHPAQTPLYERNQYYRSDNNAYNLRERNHILHVAQQPLCTEGNEREYMEEVKLACERYGPYAE